jgi:DNA-binding transcriptional ArsR family regulator
MMHSTATSDHLSLTFAALADPTRRAMLTRLGQGAATVNELAQPFNISAPAISKHLKVLEKAGLITREKEAQWRRCRIEAARLKEANEFIEKYRKFWEDSFDRLEIYLRKLQAKENNKPEGEQK